MKDAMVHQDASSAIRRALIDLNEQGWSVDAIQDPTSIGSLFGKQPRASTELVAYGFSVSNPRRRIASFRARPLNLAFAIANFLWTIRGDDDLSMISFYNDRARSFSPDGEHLIGSIGKRIFDCNGIDQFAAALELLARDRQSRRAVIQMFSPADLVSPPLDTPCSTSFQLMIRNGAVHWITYMRSQSTAMVLPYDLFLYTLLHESAAISIGLPMGRYHHVCGSLHYYEDESDLVSKMVVEEGLEDGEMPEMDTSPWMHLQEINEAESFIRRSLTEEPGKPISLSKFRLPPYWEGLLKVLIVAARKRLGANSVNDEFPELFTWMKKYV